MKLRLGTRGSPLARWQADWISRRLAESGVEVQSVIVSTAGDRLQTGSIAGFAVQGIFTKEIERALLDRRIDLAVHSLKDLPTQQQPELCLAAVPPRAPASDVLVCRIDAEPAGLSGTQSSAASLDDLPHGAVVGTGSLRRKAQLLYSRADLAVRDIRGNIDTRLRKLDEGAADAIVLAEAGLRRLNLEARITAILPGATMLPAIGQGALGVQTRTEDAVTRAALAPLEDPATRAAVTAERSLLRELRGGCLAPIGAYARIAPNGRLQLDAVVLSFDGTERLTAAGTGPPESAEQIGRDVARRLIDQGAARLIDAARG